MFLQGNFKGLHHIGIPVKDINKTVSWYTNVLGFKDIHRATIPTDNDEEIIIQFLKLGNLVLEFYQLLRDELEKVKNRPNGYINHFAIDVLDIDKTISSIQNMVSTESVEGPYLLDNVWGKGAKYINIIGPNGEIVELSQRLDLNSTRRSKNIYNLSHIGIPSLNIIKSKEFYEHFGFNTFMETEVQSASKSIKIVMLEREGITLEFYGLPDKESMPAEDGHIDHIAFDVADIQQSFVELQTAGFRIQEEELIYLPCWEKGVKYFNILGPNKERIEFNQRL
ncbi:hypothetical protein ES705_12521 [subsurface metagenome]